MKNIKFIVPGLLLLAVFFQSCEDLEEVKEPGFTITYNQVVKVGDIVEFSVENAPNFLYLYSGDFGHEYQYKDRTNAEGKVTMTFKSAQKWGTNNNKAGTLTVWASTDYDGLGTPQALEQSTWVDVSDRFDIATAYSFDWTDAGIADITDLATGDPIYFAFKFYAEDHSGTGHRQPEWRLDGFKVEMEATGAPAPLTVATMSTPGWDTVDVLGVVDTYNVGKWYVFSNYWRFRGSPSDYANEDWLLTKSINLTKVAPDKGVALKTYSESLSSFSHTYTQPGVYTITVIGNNTTIDGSEEKIEEYIIEVTE
ncbi:MAG: DUF5017 domain-containing protein [Flavobacteriaceae bacterium]|nr:DUF5017 domain-containing protein [Flavobacteriaceae bacterium]